MSNSNELWRAVTIKSLLDEIFAGEWGSEPIKGVGNAKVLRSTNLDDEGHVDYREGAIRFIPLSKLAVKKLYRGDILLEASGGGPEKPVGRVAIFEQEDDYSYLCSNFFKTLRPSQAVEPKFLLWRLLLTYSDPKIWSFQQQTTGIINLKTLEYLEQIILLPSPAEQRRIAKILDTLDNELQKTVEVIEKLKQVRLGLMQDLLTRGIDEHGEVRDPVARPELFKEMQGNIQAQIPKEWEVYHLATIAKVESGVTLGRNLSGPNTVELPYLRVANVQDGYLDLTEVKTVRVFKDEVPQFLLQPGDVLMTEGGDFDKLGRGAVWKGQISPCLHQNHIFRVRVDSRYLLPDFLAQVARSSYGKSFFVLCSKQSTNLASINSTQLKSFPVPCPSIQEQERILAILYTHDAQVQKEEARLNKLQHIKKGLMEDLLTGRVRVKGDEMAREGVGVGCEV